MNIGIFSMNNNFMGNIFSEMERRKWNLKFFALGKNEMLLTRDNFIDRARFFRMFDDIDVAYVEFAENLAMDVAIWKAINKLEIPVVVRLHRIELYEQFAHTLPWEVINDLIFVAPQCQRKFNQWIERKPSRQHLINNGYNAELFDIPIDKTYGNEIMMAGNIYWKKGHYEMIEFMSTMPDWNLNIVGDPGKQDGKEYWINCQDVIKTRKIKNVTYSPKVPQEELSSMFRDNSIILSASLEEGTHCVIAEGMLSGLYPMVRHWDGANEMYPPECVWDNFDELKTMLSWWSNLSERDKTKASAHMREWVEKRYDYETQARLLVDVIEESVARSKPK